MAELVHSHSRERHFPINNAIKPAQHMQAAHRPSTAPPTGSNLQQNDLKSAYLVQGIDRPEAYHQHKGVVVTRRPDGSQQYLHVQYGPVSPSSPNNHQLLQINQTEQAGPLLHGPSAAGKPAFMQVQEERKHFHTPSNHHPHPSQHLPAQEPIQTQAAIQAQKARAELAAASHLPIHMRPQLAHMNIMPAEPNFALTMPDKPSSRAMADAKAASLSRLLKNRPQSAPLRLTGKPRVQFEDDGDVSKSARADMRVFGRMSLFDHEHEILGPKILRDLEPPKHGFSKRPPEQFLKKNSAPRLGTRVRLSAHFKKHPINRDPEFKKGSAGINLNWESCPSTSQSLFRHLYDIGTIDFVTVRWGNLQNSIVWGKQASRGVMSWDNKPSEVELGKWLPIFVDGIREVQDPYRFLAVRGTEDLIAEAGPRLHGIAVDLVQPFKKALDTRIPVTVGIAAQLMLKILETDPLVAQVWIYHLWQFAQVFNLFRSHHVKSAKKSSSMHAASSSNSSIKHTITNILIKLEEHGGEDATAIIRRYATGHDPAVTDASIARRRAQKSQEWEPYTLM